MIDIRGKKAVVIGGTGGIGVAVSDMLKLKGCEVLALGKSRGDIVFDVSLFFAEKTALNEKKKVLTAVEGADILCVCYGPFVQKSLIDTSEEDWKNVALLDYALAGVLCSTALKGMTMRKYGRIILFGGTRTEQIRAYKTNAAYAGAKTALGVLAKSIAAEYAKDGITCNVILPGFVETEYLSQELRESLKNKTPTGTLIQTATIAEAVSFLIDRKEINGALLGIDDGWNP